MGQMRRYGKGGNQMRLLGFCLEELSIYIYCSLRWGENEEFSPGHTMFERSMGFLSENILQWQF